MPEGLQFTEPYNAQAAINFVREKMTPEQATAHVEAYDGENPERGFAFIMLIAAMVKSSGRNL